MSPRRRCCAVLGGGFIGSAVVAALVERGFETVVVTRTPPRPEAAELLAKAQVVVADVSSPNVIADLVTRTGGLHHIVYALGGSSPAASASEPDIDERAPAQLEAVLTDIETAAGPCVAFTYVSSGGAVYGHGDPSRAPLLESTPTRPVSSYGAAKAACEDAVRSHTAAGSIAGRVVRVSNAYGPRQPARLAQGLVARLFRAATTGELVTLYGATVAVRDYVYVDDVAAAIAGLVGRSYIPAVVNVGSGTGHSVAEVVTLVEAVTGLPIAVRHEPVRAFDVRSVTLDVTLLRTLVSFRTRPLRSGLVETWNWLSAHRLDEMLTP